MLFLGKVYAVNTRFISYYSKHIRKRIRIRNNTLYGHFIDRPTFSLRLTSFTVGVVEFRMRLFADTLATCAFRCLDFADTTQVIQAR